jgi:hypothetical protein
MPTEPPCEIINHGAITANDKAHDGALNVRGTESMCAWSFGYPGSDAGTYHYDVYTFTNTDSSAKCVTVLVDATGCGANKYLFSVAYLGSFNPNDLSENYLGDAGYGISSKQSYAFSVPAGATYQVLVEELNQNAGCDSYSLNVSYCW